MMPRADRRGQSPGTDFGVKDLKLEPEAKADAAEVLAAGSGVEREPK